MRHIRRVRAQLCALLPKSPLSVSIHIRRGRITREEWLVHAVEALRPVLGDVGVAFPRRIRISVGYGGNSGRFERTVGAVCFSRGASSDYVNQVFVSPVTDNEVVVLAALLHELIHAADDCQSGHRGSFARTHRAVGFVGSATGCEPGLHLHYLLDDVARDLITAHGVYPHAALGY